MSRSARTSRTKPQKELPLIEVTPRLGVSLVPSLPMRMQTSRYAIATGGWDGARFFTPDGLLHRIARLVPERPLSLIQRALAITIHNPEVSADVEYEPPRNYELEELRQLLIDAVEDDDDILTQWRDESELLDMLARAQNYGHLVRTLRFAGARPDATS